MFNFVADLIARSGPWGVFLLMLVENLVPVIPSELILPVAGLQAARGQLHPGLAILASTAGSVLGGWAWYAASRWYGLDRLRALAGRLERWLPISDGELEQAAAWFKQRGALVVCLGRAIPGVRGVICIPAGVAPMSTGSFLFWSGLGALVWSTLLVGSGYWLHANEAAVARWSNPVADGFLVIVVGLYLLRVIRYRPRGS